VARLSINQRFPDGTAVTLPVGTSALIAQTSPIAAPVIQIETPKNARLSAYLAAGDTIPSTRTVSAMDRLGDVAEQLSGEVESALGETRRLLAGTNHTVARTDSLLATTTPLVERALTQLAASLERTDRMLGSLEPRVGPVVDSMAVTLAETRQVLQRLDDLARTASSMAGENRESIRATVENLRRSSIIMDHFVDQVSRRPTRMLTGVRPPAAADSTGPRP
jgi:ABC-type transporter Mla subunit MlaD